VISWFFKESLRDIFGQDICYIFNLDLIYRHFARLLFNSYYSSYFKFKPRELCSLLGDKRLSSLTMYEKLTLAKNRAEHHNRAIKYKETKEENTRILSDFLEYLKKKNVKVVIVNFTATSYYRQFLKDHFVEEYKEIITRLREIHNFDFIDLNEYSCINDNDFTDFDHFGDSGAIKVSEILNQYLKT